MEKVIRLIRIVISILDNGFMPKSKEEDNLCIVMVVFIKEGFIRTLNKAKGSWLKLMAKWWTGFGCMISCRQGWTNRSKKKFRKWSNRFY